MPNRQKVNRNDKSVPLYRQVEEVILTQIESGKFKAGETIPSERTLASEMGVSYITVRQAIGELENRNFVTRIQGRGTFINGSDEPEIQNIGLFLFSGISITHTYSAAILEGIENISRQTGYTMQVNTSYGKRLNAKDAPLQWDYIQNRKINGIMLQNPIHTDDYRDLLNMNMPLVTLFHYRNFDCHRVMVAKGHKRIGLLVRPPSAGNKDVISSTETYIEGYKSSLKEARLPFDPELIIDEGYKVNTKHLTEKSVKNVERFFDLKEPVTAIVATTSVLLETLMRAVSNRNLSVPQDISITAIVEHGFDTNFTRIEVNSTDLAEIATDRLIRLIKGQAFNQKSVLVKFPLVKGNTVKDLKKE